jgi:hypothetical protein
MRYGAFDHLMEELWARARLGVRIKAWVSQNGKVCAVCGEGRHAGRMGAVGLDVCQRVVEAQPGDRPPGRAARRWSARRHRSRS